MISHPISGGYLSTGTKAMVEAVSPIFLIRGPSGYATICNFSHTLASLQETSEGNYSFTELRVANLRLRSSRIRNRFDNVLKTEI
jgi:hypothetical protein